MSELLTPLYMQSAVSMTSWSCVVITTYDARTNIPSWSHALIRLCGNCGLDPGNPVNLFPIRLGPPSCISSSASLFALRPAPLPLSGLCLPYFPFQTPSESSIVPFSLTSHQTFLLKTVHLKNAGTKLWTRPKITLKLRGTKEIRLCGAQNTSLWQCDQTMAGSKEHFT